MKKALQMAEMDIISLDQNLDAFEDFENLPKGKYPAECIQAEVRTSDAGNDFIYTNWRIETADYPADYDVENAPEGTTLNYSRVQVPQGGNRRAITALKKLRSACGLPTSVKEFDVSEFVGCKATLICALGAPFNGERRLQIQSIESIDA